MTKRQTDCSEKELIHLWRGDLLLSLKEERRSEWWVEWEISGDIFSKGEEGVALTQPPAVARPSNDASRSSFSVASCSNEVVGLHGTCSRRCATRLVSISMRARARPCFLRRSCRGSKAWRFLYLGSHHRAPLVLLTALGISTMVEACQQQHHRLGKRRRGR